MPEMVRGQVFGDLPSDCTQPYPLAEVGVVQRATLWRSERKLVWTEVSREEHLRYPTGELHPAARVSLGRAEVEMAVDVRK